MSNNDKTTVPTALGNMMAHPPHMTTHYGSSMTVRTVDLPEDGVTINGVTYEGHVRLTVYRGRDSVIFDCDLVSRAGSIGSWGTITDAARRKIGEALAEVAEDLLVTASDSAWRREYVAAEVRRSTLAEVRSLFATAYRIPRDLGGEVDAESIARDVLLNLTADDLTRY